jgi:hypothetical protein
MRDEAQNWIIPVGATIIVWIWIFILIATNG